MQEEYVLENARLKAFEVCGRLVPDTAGRHVDILIASDSVVVCPVAVASPAAPA